uniref:cytochrome-c oxidase n=1 Tax=Pseudorhabdosynochus yangjiangensis TaxID=1131907 RepID=A0A3G0WMP2_9PLAT|nr:cytochrome c oxidase subunit II [Pseudorhabdosynochus yangjiangensis]
MNLNILYFDIVNYISLLCIFIVIFVISLLIQLIFFIGGVSEVNSESHFLEFIWTVIPTFGVLGLCLLNVNFVINEVEGFVNESIKIIGRQWYWSYEVNSDSEINAYDSYMLQLVNNVDNPLVMKYGNVSRLLITSSDVIHSFSVPSLGIKMDAIPGRINQVIYVPDRIGIFVGYCSELCGVGHSYMPIVVEVIK